MLGSVRIASLLGRRFEIDFVQARPPIAPLGWLLLGFGLLALMAALADFAPRWLEHERLLREVEELHLRLDRLPGVARPVSRGSDSTGLAQATGLLGELDHPWPALFDQFESVAVPDVHLVQMAVDSRFQTVQMVAEASTLERVLQYSQQLPGKGPVRAVRLTRHEWRNAPSGRIVVADLTADLVAGTPADSLGDKGAR